MFTSGGSVSLLGLDPSSNAVTPANATASYSLTSAGLETASGNANNTWLLAGAASDYEARVTVNSGSLTTGTTGSWLGLGTTRTWTLVNSSDTPGTTTASVTVEIRTVSGSVVVASAPVDFTATVLS